VSSAIIERIAADTNVLLSAIAGKAARRVFSVPDLRVVTTERNLAEVEEYIPVFAVRYGLSEPWLHDVLRLLPVEIYDESEYASEITAAREWLSGRDEDDVGLAALALTLRIPIWSNDNDYSDFPLGLFTTARLLKVLQV
jgi:predicted nucleic acid-binding protein